MERPSMPLAALQGTHWEKTDLRTFSELWARELEDVPEFSESRFHVVTGLLLPIWKRLPVKNPRVYRFETDEGERVIGRLIPQECLDEFTPPDKPLSPEEAWAALTAGGKLRLAGGLALRRANVMHAARIELTGFSAEEVPALKALGLVAEIIAYRLRLFVPMSADGPTILARLLDRHPPIGTGAPPA
jgi:hypothetical protein